MSQFDELADLIATGRVSHTRAGDRLYRGSVLVYGHDETSPSGVLLAMVVPDSEEFASLLKNGLSPLSPCEPR